MKSLLKTITVIFLFVLMSFFPATKKSATNQYQGLAVMKMSNPSDVSYNTLQEIINKNPELTIEYGCVETGIIVIEFTSPVPRKSENQMMILNKLKRCKECGEVETIFLEVHSKDESSNC